MAESAYSSPALLSDQRWSQCVQRMPKMNTVKTTSSSVASLTAPNTIAQQPSVLIISAQCLFEAQQIFDDLIDLLVVQAKAWRGRHAGAGFDRLWVMQPL